MQCPYCHQEMQAGAIAGDGRGKVYWQPDGEKTSFFDKLSGTRQIEAAKYTLASFTIAANYCPACKKMIFETDISE